MSGFRAFLSVPGTVRLLASSLAGRLPLGMSSLALLLLVRLQTGSFATAGLVVGAFTLSSAAASPLLGILVDRVGARPLLVMVAVGQAGALPALVIAAQSGATLAILVVVAALAGALTPPISGCVRALWPRVTPTAEVLDAAISVGCHQSGGDLDMRSVAGGGGRLRRITGRRSCADDWDHSHGHGLVCHRSGGQSVAGCSGSRSVEERNHSARPPDRAGRDRTDGFRDRRR